MVSFARFAKIAVLLMVFLSGVFLGFSLFSTPKTPVGISENQAISLTDRDYFPTVHHLLNSANSSIRMIMFDVKYYPDYPESLENSLLSDLESAVERGVDVRIITDEYLTEKPVVRILEEKGINIKFDPKDITTHGKLIIIDSKIVIVGSTNWGYHSIEKNHEANVVIHSASLARQFGDYFERVWAES